MVSALPPTAATIPIEISVQVGDGGLSELGEQNVISCSLCLLHVRRDETISR